MTVLTARKPEIATDDATFNWSTTPEFAHIFNGASVMIPFVEHYLNNVMNEVRTHYCQDRPALRQELDEFIAQETTHARYHMKFNKQMFGAFAELKPLVDQTIEDLKRKRDKYSLAFNVAYCAGFETTATFSARYILEECDRYFLGGDGYGCNLCQWHLAEEFEHRTTCHRAFAAVSGNYFIRVAGLVYSFWHIGRMFNRASRVIFAKYREGMTAEERAASCRMEKFLVRRQTLFLLPRMARLLVPFYDPARLKVPPRIQAALDYYTSRDPLSVSFADAVKAMEAAG